MQAENKGASSYRDIDRWFLSKSDCSLRISLNFVVPSMTMICGWRQLQRINLCFSLMKNTFVHLKKRNEEKTSHRWRRSNPLRTGIALPQIPNIRVNKSPKAMKYERNGRSFCPTNTSVKLSNGHSKVVSPPSSASTKWHTLKLRYGWLPSTISSQPIVIVDNVHQ